MSQQKPVTIICIKVLNSHDQYKVSKAMEKVRSELAIRAKDPVVEELLVMLLNQANEDVHKFQESPKGIALKQRVAEEESGQVIGPELAKEKGQLLAQTVAEQPDLHMDMKDPPRQPAVTSEEIGMTCSGRKVQKPTKLLDEYANDKEYLGFVSNQSGKQRRQANDSESDFNNGADASSSLLTY